MLLLLLLCWCCYSSVGVAATVSAVGVVAAVSAVAVAVAAFAVLLLVKLKISLRS